jgi:hypothetical protein
MRQMSQKRFPGRLFTWEREHLGNRMEMAERELGNDDKIHPGW